MSLPVRKDELIPQPHGGALRNGGTNKGGKGRPKNEVVAKMRTIAGTESVRFIRGLLRGDVRLRFVGQCPECGKDSPIDSKYTEQAAQAALADVRAKLAASEQSFKYGVGTQVEVISREDVEKDAKAMLGVFVDWAREKWNIPTDQIQECAAAMARAVTTTTEG